ncbi:MAG TPA: hypothetical protein PLL69_00710, partial [Gemmatimonadales bacterium]|nr:hypothetical protein [Gemmatimonadales bacterium]
KSWTTLTTSSGTGNGTVAWNRSTVGLAPGTYVDTITVTSSGADGSPARVIDTLIITTAPVPLTLAVSPGSRSTSAQQGTAAAGASAVVTLTGDGAATTAWTASSKKNWTTLAPASGTGSGTVAWSRSTAGLAPGIHVDTVTVIAAGLTAEVIDSLIITPVPVPVALAVSPGSRSTSAVQGTAAAGGSASVTLTGDGAATTAWTAAKKKSWTTLTISTGTGNGTVAWNRSTAGLAAGIYVDTITVTAAGQVAWVIDSIEVAGVPATPAGVVLARSSRRHVMNRIPGFTSLVQPDSVRVVRASDGNSDGLPWSVKTTGAWLAVKTTAGTGQAHFRYEVKSDGMAAGTYVDSIEVALVSDPSIRAFHVDTLVVTDEAAPEPTLAVRDLFAGGGRLSPNQRIALDGAGNRNGRYDLGDFLAWVSRAGLRLSAATMAELNEVIERESEQEAAGWRRGQSTGWRN